MSQLSRAIQNTAKQGMSSEKIYSSICKVISVDESTRTCQLEPINGDAERKGRLQASLSLSEGVYVKPVINSYVQLTYINNITGVITAFSEIESIEIITSEGCDLSISSKFKIENKTTSLLTAIEKLITACTNITVPTPSGTSGMPINVAEFQLAEQEFNKILE